MLYPTTFDTGGVRSFLPTALQKDIFSSSHCIKDYLALKKKTTLIFRGLEINLSINPGGLTVSFSNSCSIAVSFSSAVAM